VSGTKAGEGRPTLPLQFLAAWLAVWLGRVLQRQIDYLKEENRALKEQLGDRKLRLTDATRRRLAVLGKELGRKALAEVATIATSETILRWYRELVAKKYDGNQRRGPGRPRKRGKLAELLLKSVSTEWCLLGKVIFDERSQRTWRTIITSGAIKGWGTP
jgi:hypothetical protein